MKYPKALILLLVLSISLLLFYWFWLRAPRSIQAFVNTGITVLRAPIAGKLVLASDIKIGKHLQQGAKFGTIATDIENQRVSQLRVQEQEIVTRSKNLEEQISGINARIRDREQQLKRYTAENAKQRDMELEYNEARANTAKQEYSSSEVALSIARNDLARAKAVSAQGFISAAALERAEGAARQAAADLEVKKALIAQFELQKNANRAELQLDGSRTLSQPASRSRELRSEILDLMEQLKTAKNNLASASNELKIVKSELVKISNQELSAPMTGVVWSIAAQPGESINTSGEILQMVNCNDVWVEGFFDEADAASLELGREVTVKALRGQDSWRGKIAAVRYGAGRVNVGQYVVDPPPEIAHRQLPVRVATVRVNVDWNSSLKPELFCNAGRSVSVSLN